MRVRVPDLKKRSFQLGLLSEYPVKGIDVRTFIVRQVTLLGDLTADIVPLKWEDEDMSAVRLVVIHKYKSESDAFFPSCRNPLE